MKNMDLEYLWYSDNTMAADGLATHVARTSAAKMLT